MDVYTPLAAPAPSSSTDAHGPPQQRRRSSRSNSLSSSSVVTVKRPESLTLNDAAIPDPSRPHKRASPPTPPPAHKRRRSSAAGLPHDGPPAFSAGIANVNRWSQSTASSSKSPPQPQQHAVARNLNLSVPSAPLLPALNGASPPPGSPSHLRSTSSPSRNDPSRSPAASPQRRSRPRSPAYHSSSSVTAPPKLPSLPYLPATAYDPSTPNTVSSNNSPSTADLFVLSAHPAPASTDYFSSKPRAPSASSHRPPSRSKADRVLGRSPLGSPPIGLLESEARYNSSATNPRPATANRPSTVAPRDTTPRPAQTAGRERSSSKDQDSRNRSESNASSRPDDGYQSTPPRTRERREKDKKTMLSRALQKANTAVLLDNAQNFEGAVEAYGDACRLLQQVMLRSSGEEDRRKLDAIRVTYTNRIEELRRLDTGGQTVSGKSLPARPMSNESLDEHRSLYLGTVDDEEPAIIETASVTRIVNDRSAKNQANGVEPEPSPSQSLPLRTADSGGVRESVISNAIRDVQKDMNNSATFFLQAPPGRLGDAPPSLNTAGLESPMDRSYMPPPLSPRRPLSPTPTTAKDYEPSSHKALVPPEPFSKPDHKRGNSSESISWLDTIDESGGSSCSSSVHSLSPGGMRRKHLRNASGATEAEFDAALDAAVEAAYDEGYEPYEDEAQPNSAEIIATRLRNVELAKERVREAEREEAIAAAKYRYKEIQLRNEALPHVRESVEFNFNDEAEEEERLLDEMTREYMLDGFDFDLQTKSSLPRQSDSSGFSGSTYNSHGSVSSHRHTGGTSLSTVAEVMHPPKQKAPTHSPPPIPSALPSVAEAHTTENQESSESTDMPTREAKEAASVRSRRLSGQNAKTLKIQTSLPSVPPAPQTDKPLLAEKDLRAAVPPLPKSAAAANFSSTSTTIDPDFKVPALLQTQQLAGLTAPSPQLPVPSPADTTFTISPATPALSHAMSNDTTLVPSSPKTGKSSAMGIRKNKSSLSLKQRNLSISSPDGSDASIGTPLSTTFSFTGRKPSIAAAPAPTPSVPTFNVEGLPSGGMHLFESDIHSPYSPGSPSGAVANAPIPLEPCPDAYLLRPFWLMRCFYQTIAHPRGGYLSTKLFVPRDVWRVKGVKLKNIDDKIANCDLLTAALQRLGTVDTLDADAVLEEMQALEVVLDQVQTQLAKKLGNEVGVHSVSTLFKDATSVGGASGAGEGSEKGSHGSQDHAPKSAVSQSKSYLTSWRKLRSKNSAVGLSSLTGAKSGNEVAKDSLTMPTLPMTSLPNIRFAKRDLSAVVFEGPNALYMGSLARLFDSVQILDQIARQVEDPGLKHSSQTHVGLELSARHAAEFFGFYICRFVLADLTLMLDKFIKRGSEWVLV